MNRIIKSKDHYWLFLTNTDPIAEFNHNKIIEQTKKEFNGTLGKYLIFCDNLKKLEELTKYLLISFDLCHAKLSLNKKENCNKGFGHVSCIYDYEPKLKSQIYDAILEYLPAIRDNVFGNKPYPFNYRYWKSDQKTLSENKRSIIQNNNFIQVPQVIFTRNGKLKEGIDVFAKSFSNYLDDKMMDNHPEIFNSEWEDKCIDFLN